MNWIILILFLFLGTSAYAGLRAAPWFPTWSRDLDRFFKFADIEFRDFWNADISNADIVYLFLTPKVNPKAKLRLEKELKKGARVIAYTWPIEDWPIAKEDLRPGQPPMYLYIIQ